VCMPFNQTIVPTGYGFKMWGIINKPIVEKLQTEFIEILIK